MLLKRRGLRKYAVLKSSELLAALMSAIVLTAFTLSLMHMANLSLLRSSLRIGHVRKHKKLLLISFKRQEENLTPSIVRMMRWLLVLLWHCKQQV